MSILCYIVGLSLAFSVVLSQQASTVTETQGGRSGVKVGQFSSVDPVSDQQKRSDDTAFFSKQLIQEPYSMQVKVFCLPFSLFLSLSSPPLSPFYPLSTPPPQSMLRGCSS